MHHYFHDYSYNGEREKKEKKEEEEGEEEEGDASKVWNGLRKDTFDLAVPKAQMRI